MEKCYENLKLSVQFCNIVYSKMVAGKIVAQFSNEFLSRLHWMLDYNESMPGCEKSAARRGLSSSCSIRVKSYSV